MQRHCTFTLASDGCTDNKYLGDEFKTFEILISTEPWKRSTATVTRQVIVNVLDGEEWLQLRFDRRKGKCSRDGVDFFLPNEKTDVFSAKYDGRKLFLILYGGKVRLEWDYRHNVVVELADEFKNQVCGLCGNFNGDKHDDLMLKDGTVVNYKKADPFGKRWTYSSAKDFGECKDDLIAEPHPCETLQKNDAEAYEKVVKFCSQMRKGEFSECFDSNLANFIAEMIRDCEYDSCLEPLDLNEQCSYAEEVADACAKGGFEIGLWQQRNFCGMVQCPVGKVFKENSKPDRTCSDPDREPRGRRRAGCFCPDGMFLEGDNCVERSSCGCSHRGKYLRHGESKVVDKCRKRLTCQGGEMIEEELTPCHQKAWCDRKNGVCKCWRGYKGDGHNCVSLKNAEHNLIGVDIGGELKPLSFSSSSEGDDTKASDGRLNNDKCWTAESTDTEPWLAVNLLGEFQLQGVRLQSCPDSNCTISQFTVFYRRAGGEEEEGETFEEVKLKGRYSDFVLNDPVDGVTHVKISPKNQDGCVGLRMDVIAERSDCEERSTPLYRSCYFLVPDKATVDDARQYCEAEGYRLAWISDQNENGYLKKIADNKDTVIDFEVDEDGNLLSENGDRINFDRFEGNRDENEDCLMRKRYGKLRFITCGKKSSFICEQNDACQPGWTKASDGGCYKFFDTKMTYSDADKKCAEEGGHIPEPESTEENDALSEMAQMEIVWIGCTDAQEEGTWVYISSKTVLAYDNFVGNEPNNYANGEGCAVTNWKKLQKSWNDVPCDSKRKVVCKYGLSPHHKFPEVCKDKECNGASCVTLFNPIKGVAEAHCACKKTQSGENCDGGGLCNCFAWGDPHFGTCDGRNFNFQGKGAYIMAQNGCNDPSTRTFQIVIETTPFEKYPGTTACKTVIIFIDYRNGRFQTVVRLERGDHNVYVNDAPASHILENLPEGCSLRPHGNKLIFRHRLFKVEWNQDKRIDIYMEKSNETVCGLCGNFDGNRDNDIMDINGNGKFDKEDGNAFGLSWSYGEKFDLPDPPEPVDQLCARASEKVQEKLRLALDIINGETFAECLVNFDQEEKDQMITEIKMELCSSEDDAFCRIMRAAQEKCSETNVEWVCWQDPANLLCASSTDTENAHYVCGRVSEMTCFEAQVPLPQYDDGYFCKPGFFRNSGGKCVTQEQCGCKFRDTTGVVGIMEINERMVDPNCDKIYHCELDETTGEGTLRTELSPCHPSARCDKERLECVCNDGFEGDGKTYCLSKSTPEPEGVELGVSCGKVPSASITTVPEQGDKSGRYCENPDSPFFEVDLEEENFPYIQIDLTHRTTVTGFIYRGRREDSCYAEFVIVKYSNSPESPDWECQEAEGEEAVDGCKKIYVAPDMRKIAFTAFRKRFVRIYPLASKPRRVCAQVELIGEPLQEPCKDGYEQIGGGCYHVSKTEMNYDDGAAYCENLEGGYLVEISSRKENNVIRELIGDKPVLLGLKDSLKNYHPTHPKGSPLFFTNFPEGEPNGMLTDAFCFFMQDKWWYSLDCTTPKQVVCESEGDAMVKLPRGHSIGVQFRGEIKPPALTASSFMENLPPTNGRLYQRGSFAAWCPNTDDDKTPYIQVDLGTKFRVTGIITQGRADAKGYTKKFTIQHSKNCVDFEPYLDDDNTALVFNGNKDRNTQIVNKFKAFRARCVRVYPEVEGNGAPVCLRFDLYGKYIKPEKRCLTSFLGVVAVGEEQLPEIPDRHFIASHCPEDRENPHPDANYCAAFARWSDNWENGMWFAAGDDQGRRDFIQLDFGVTRGVTAIRVAVKHGTIPLFHLSGSRDGQKYMCLTFKQESPPTKKYDGEENIYQLEAPGDEGIDLKYIRLNPLCDGVTHLRIDVFGCLLKD